MRKIRSAEVICLFVAGGLLLVIPQAYGQAEVYSVNVVGFQRLTAVSGGLTLVSTPFDRVTNTLDAIIGPQLTGGKSEGAADGITLWNKNSQQYERYWLKASDSNWYDVAGQRATATVLDTYTGFFIRNRRVTNQVVVVSGDVPSAHSRTNVLVPGLTMASYPFSASIDINKSALTNGKAGKSEGTADTISIWDAGNQAYVRFWLRQSDRKWCTLENQVATNVFIGQGKGFFYRNRTSSNFYWVETRPYTF